MEPSVIFNAPIENSLPVLKLAPSVAQHNLDVRITHEYLHVPAGATRCIIPIRSGAMTRLRFDRLVKARLFVDGVIIVEFIGTLDMVRPADPRWERLQSTIVNNHRGAIIGALQRIVPAKSVVCCTCRVHDQAWLDFEALGQVATLEIELAMPWIRLGQKEQEFYIAVEPNPALSTIKPPEWRFMRGKTEAACWFVLMLMLGDGLLRGVLPASVEQFARVFQRLPREMQERICGAAYGLEKLVTVAEIEAVLKWLNQ